MVNQDRLLIEVDSIHLDGEKYDDLENFRAQIGVDDGLSVRILCGQIYFKKVRTHSLYVIFTGSNFPRNKKIKVYVDEDIEWSLSRGSSLVINIIRIFEHGIIEIYILRKEINKPKLKNILSGKEYDAFLRYKKRGIEKDWVYEYKKIFLDGEEIEDFSVIWKKYVNGEISHSLELYQSFDCENLYIDSKIHDGFTNSLKYEDDDNSDKIFRTVYKTVWTDGHIDEIKSSSRKFFTDVIIRGRYKIELLLYSKCRV